MAVELTARLGWRPIVARLGFAVLLSFDLADVGLDLQFVHQLIGMGRHHRPHSRPQSINHVANTVTLIMMGLFDSPRLGLSERQFFV